VIIHSLYNLPAQTVIINDDPSLTQQHFKEECDVNNIINKFIKTGVMPLGTRKPQYGDFSAVPDYQQAQDQLNQAKDAFSQMPSAIRKRFNNDPAELIKFVLDPKNREEAIKIGLIDTPEPKKEALSDEIIRKLSESMSMEKKLQNEANLKPSETEKK